MEGYLSSKNPSNGYRHYLFKTALSRLNRVEDAPFILEAMKKPVDIDSITNGKTFKNTKVGVIGGGLAGLAATYELKKMGCQITLFEGSKQRIGGRVFTHHFNEQNYGELGAMRIPVSHETTWHYLNHLGLNTQPFIKSSPNDILYVKQMRFMGQNNDELIKQRLYPLYPLSPWEAATPLSDLQLMAYNEPLLKMTPETRSEILKTTPDYSDTINTYDSLNFYQALDLLGYSEGGSQLLYDTMSIDRGVFYNSYLEQLKEMYMANFTYVYQIEGGMQKLPHALFNEIKDEPNVDIRMDHRIVGIYDANNQVALKILHNERAHFEQFDYIVCAMPFSRLRLCDIHPLFSSEKMRAISELNYSNSQKSLLFSNQRFWERAINHETSLGGSSLTDLTLTSLWYPSNRLASSGVFTASYNIEQDANRLGNLRSPEQLYIIKREVERVHGLPPHQLDNLIDDYVTMNWNHYDLTLGAFAWFKPGQSRRFSYVSQTPEFNHKVFFAGEHTSNVHAWMQGALQTGARAANRIAKRLVNDH